MIDQDSAREALGTINAAEKNLYAMMNRIDGITNYMFAGYIGSVWCFVLSNLGREILGSSIYVLIAFVTFFSAILIWAMHGKNVSKISVIRPVRDISASLLMGGIIAFILIQALTHNGAMILPNSLTSWNFQNTARYLAEYMYAFSIGIALGYFIWLGRSIALFSVLNLSVMMAVFWFSTSPEKALNWLMVVAAFQFLIGIYLTKFQAR